VSGSIVLGTPFVVVNTSTNAPWQCTVTGVNAGESIGTFYNWPNNSGTNERPGELISDNHGQTWNKRDRADDTSASGSSTTQAWDTIGVSVGGSYTLSVDKSGGGDNDDYIGAIPFRILGISSFLSSGKNFQSGLAAGTDNITCTSDVTIGNGVNAFAILISSNTTDNTSSPGAPLASSGWTDMGTMWDFGFDGVTTRITTKSFVGNGGTFTATMSAKGTDNYISVLLIYQESGGAPSGSEIALPKRPALSLGTPVSRLRGPRFTTEQVFPPLDPGNDNTGRKPGLMLGTPWSKLKAPRSTEAIKGTQAVLATASTRVVATAALSAGIALLAGAGAKTGATASLTTGVACAAQAANVGSASASLTTTSAPWAAQASGNCQATAALSSSIQTAAAASARVSATAALNSGIALAAAAQNVAGASSALTSGIVLAATAASRIDAGAALTTAPATIPALGIAQGRYGPGLTGPFNPSQFISPRGTTQPQAAALAALAGSRVTAGAALGTGITLAANAACVSSAQAQIGGGAQFAVQAAALISARGTLSTGIALSASAGAVATTSADLTTRGPTLLSAVASAKSSATAAFSTGAGFGTVASARTAAQASFSTQVRFSAAAAANASAIATFALPSPNAPPERVVETRGYERTIDTAPDDGRRIVDVRGTGRTIGNA